MTLNQAPLPHGEKPAQHPRSRANLTQHRPSTRAGDFEVAVNVTPELRARLAQTGRGASAFGFAAGSITVSVGGFLTTSYAFANVSPSSNIFRPPPGMGFPLKNSISPPVPFIYFRSVTRRRLTHINTRAGHPRSQ